MKRITQIEIENFRAFYQSYKIRLPEGQNLLVYGENGSGKSSLYKALSIHLASSRLPTLGFSKNNYRPAGDDGFIRITFADQDPATLDIISASAIDLEFGTSVVSNNVNFLQDTELTKGFLDYRILLAVYNHREPNPNLFSLILFELLQNFIPVGYGYPLGVRFTELTHEIENSYTRQTWAYRIAIGNLSTYETVLRDTLNRIFVQLNYFLIRYFKLNLRVGYTLRPFVASPYSWRTIPQELNLTIKHNGLQVAHQSDYLNEARLSALSVCLYLAAQKQIPQNIDFKILFLDDVFIGLDSGNRIPIAKILSEEFKEYQIFVTTYDRNWFELAQRFFKSHNSGKWESLELYSSTQEISGLKVEIPIMLPYEENFDRGSYYLHHKSRPDYPASANFFRKSLEEILKNNLPSHEIRDENYAMIETYRLGALVSSGLKFLQKIAADDKILLELQNALPTLLHPLSHYELSTQVYKVELERVEHLIPLLQDQLLHINLNCKVFIPKGRSFTLKFSINGTDNGFYEIYSKETIYALRASNGALTLSVGGCHCKCSYRTSSGGEISRSNFSPAATFVQYISVLDSYETIYNHIHVQPEFSHIPIAINPLNEFEYYNDNTNQTLEQHLQQVIW
ncbi:AAA family ATPase [Flavobacterium terrisoli]|uniref:AAA family ATPase n=1 Tax=Flavobacterium terrisoli TaxID=3242195 RepID=UPI0025437CFF|nr:AAA family ATPase [Flavobacterium buctense]